MVREKAEFVHMEHSSHSYLFYLLMSVAGVTVSDYPPVQVTPGKLGEVT